MRALAALLILSACDAGTPAQESRPTSKPPAALCAELAKGLDQLRGRGAVDYDSTGEATVEDQVWQSLGPDGRERFARSLAFHAACAAPEGLAEQRVVIRNNWGATLMQRTIDTRADIGSMLDE